MNQGLNYKKGYVNELLQLLHIVGVIPYRCLRLLSETPKMYQRAACDLQKSGDVVIDSKGGEKNIRLANRTTNAKKYKSYIAEVYYSHYEAEGYKAPARLSDKKIANQKKQMRDCATQIMMYACGIEMTPDKKDLKKEGEWIEREDLIYYDSKEIKKIQAYHDNVIMIKGEKGTYSKKLQNSRITGLLISPGGIYGVYNIGNQMLEWKRTGEVKMANYILQIVRNKNIEEDMLQDKKECIIIARTQTLFYKILTLNYQRNNIKNERTLLNIDYAYNKMYAIPENRNGMLLIKMMTVNGWKKKIYDSMFSQKEQENAKFVSVTCDAYNAEEDIYKLTFCVPDMVKLKSFVVRAKLENNRKQFELYCFTMQLDMIAEFVRDAVQIYKIDLQEYVKSVFDME